MVLSFFRRGDPGMSHITTRIVAMVGDARHSFDVATSVILSGGDPAAAAEDIRSTDSRINQIEHEVRRELIVHVAVQGAADIGLVLGYSLLVKKVERIGDQAKNIVDLALEGVSLAGADDVGEFVDAQRMISGLFGDVASLLLEPDAGVAASIVERANTLSAQHAARIRELVHSDAPGHHAVPRAVLHRYLKRIVDNLAGVAQSVTDPDAELDTDPDD